MTISLPIAITLPSPYPPAAQPDHRTLPRKKRAPSLRDQAIFVAHRVDGKTQTQLAQHYGLSQRRISAIVSRVQRWRADAIPAAEGELERKQKQRLDRWLEEQRLSGIYNRSLRAHDSQVAELTTTRKGDRDGKPFQEETTRQQPLSAQFLKIALRATADLGKFSDKPSLEAYNSQDERDQLYQAAALLVELRRNARKRGELAPAGRDDEDVVVDAIRELIGRGKPEGGTSSGNNVHSDTSGDAGTSFTAQPEVAAPSADEPAPNGGDSSSGSIAGQAMEAPAASAEPIEAVEISAENPSAEPTCESTCVAPPEAAEPCSPAAKKTAAQPVLKAEPSPAERRLRHQEKLREYYEALRTGRPYHLFFDSADGPIPRPVYQIDDVGYQRSPPPTSEENRRQNEECIARLQACVARNAGPLPP